MTQNATQTAIVLSTLSREQSATTSEIADRTGLDLKAVRKALRAMSRRGFVFCEDDFEGIRRTRGQYDSRLWVMNFETNGFDEVVAQTALSRRGNGHDIACAMGIGC